MIIIKDNVLSDSSLALVQQSFFCSNQPNYSNHWIDKANIPTYIHEILNVVKNNIDLKSYTGVEWWTQKDGSLPPKGWHYDVDENIWKKEHKVVTPICSIIYYPLIANLEGGLFKTEDTIITPKTNRLIIMSPNILHTVEPYNGTRWSFLINPWSYKLEWALTSFEDSTL